MNSSRSARYFRYFLPKKDIILPEPGFAPFFAAALFALADVVGAGFIFFGAGSSSENDSQAQSSLVTVHWSQLDHHFAPIALHT